MSAAIAPASALTSLQVDTKAAALKRTQSESESHSAWSAKTLVGSESFQETKTTATKTVFSETRTRTMTMELHESSKDFKLEGTSTLVARCLLADGKTYTTSKIVLDKHIGNIDGQLVWHGENFSQSAEDVRLDGTILRARCKRASHNGGGYVETSLELKEKLRNDNGILMMIAYDEKLSVALSEVPWMKFKVVAEPDFAVIASHPVIRGTLTQISNSTVEHVTSQFEMLMAAALATTIKLVTESAREHIEQSLVVMTQNLAKEAANAHLHSSYTASGYLKSDHQMCGCQPFRCSCPPSKVSKTPVAPTAC